MRGTAYQRNADGDSATFSSRLGDLTGEERAELAQLRKRDQEVRTHESAHIAAGGGLVRGGPTFDFQTGPDGRDYAAGGHVRIDSSPGSTPEETIAKARRIRQAALAPAEPSSQDLAVAAKASGMEAAARAALSRTSRQGRLRQLDARPTADRTTPDRAPSPAHADGVRLDVFG
ncbi:MAG: hypothetical protein DYG94_02235 [Leptolyngbya sp. PLA3]|nr:MAG: hypothetical protein EDM82_02320 [Cyanobacteria bacterium CYA]MCE7967550.1 hypothetical protein [Leptolyngbya sp. PL-A3]